MEQETLLILVMVIVILQIFNQRRITRQLETQIRKLEIEIEISEVGWRERTDIVQQGVMNSHNFAIDLDNKTKKREEEMAKDYQGHLEAVQQRSLAVLKKYKEETTKEISELRNLCMDVISNRRSSF